MVCMGADVFIFLFCLLRYNSDILKFTILKGTIQWFLAYSQICATIISVKLQYIFITPKRKPVTYSQSLPIPPFPQPQAAINLFPVSMDLPIPDISHKWNHLICGLLRLFSFTRYNVFRVHPCCSLCQYFVPFCG